VVAPRVELPEAVRLELAALRREAKLSSGQLCQLLEIRQPGTFQAWEAGTSRPTVPQLQAYLLAIGADAAAVMPRVQVGASRLGRIYDLDASSGALSPEAGAVARAPGAAASGRDHVRLAALDREDLDWFADREDFELASERTGKPGITRYLHVTPELMMLLGGYASSGSCLPADGIRLAGGDLEQAGTWLAAAFGLPAHACEVSRTLAQVKLTHPVATLAWHKLCGPGGAAPAARPIPDLVWSVAEPLRSAFLHGYLRASSDGAGHVHAGAHVHRAIARPGERAPVPADVLWRRRGGRCAGRNRRPSRHRRVPW
jgi:hypothetical protein